MDEFLILLQAKLDETKSKGNINADIDVLQEKLNKIKLQATIDPNAAQLLAKEIEKVSNQKIIISNIGIDQNVVVKSAQQTGKQMSNAISKEMSSASTATNKILRDFSELNTAKRQFVDGHDLISKDDISDAEKFYNTVRQAFSEFGQVTVSKGDMSDGALENMRVKIEQVNGEMKITRDFMLYFNSVDDFGNKFKLADDDTIHTTEKMIQHLNTEKNIVNATNEEANAIKEKLAEQEKYYSRIKEDVKLLYNLKQKLLSADELQTAELEKQIKSTKQRITYNNQQIDKKDLRDNSLDRQINNLEVAKQKQLALSDARTQDTANAKAQVQAQKEVNVALKEQQSLQSQVNKIQLSIGDNSDTTAQINVLRDNFTKLGLSADEVTAKMNSVDNEIKELKILLNNGASNSAITAQFDKLQLVLKETQNDLKTTRSEYSLLISVQRRLSKANEIEAWNQKNSKATKEVKTANEAYIASLRDLNSQMTKMKYNEIINGFKQSEISMRSLSRLGASLKDQFSQAAHSFTQWLSVSSAVMLLLNQLRKMPKAVYDIDTAMTNLYKVTDETESKYVRFLDSASDSAKELGRSISSLVEQTANWAKLGFSIDEASKLAEISSVYANVGEVDDDTAVKDIVTALKAFNIEAENSISIVDSLNKLGNEFATDAKSLGEGLRNTASSMAVAGNDINQTLAILTGGGEITQNVAELSNGLRVVSMRLRGMKGELQEIGEEYEDIESISKIQTQIYDLTKGSVNIFKDDGTFKSTYDQLKEISEIFFDLNDQDRANLTEIMFGKNRANQGIAILQAFKSGQVQKAYEASVNSAGSAMQEQERWLGSLEAKTQQFEAAFQSLSNTVVDSDLLKEIVDLGTTGVSALEGFAKILGTINSLGGNVNGIFGAIGAASGLLMNKTGIGERTMFQWRIVLAPTHLRLCNNAI